MQLKKIITEVISILFIILWVYAAVSKLTDYSQFRFQLGRSPYIQDFATFVSVALPAGELLMAALLVFGRTRLLGMYLSLFTMILFTGYIYAILHFSYYVPCSCGGILSELTWSQHLIFNIAFVILGFIGTLLQSQKNVIPAI